jgi:hypothetical protein
MRILSSTGVAMLLVVCVAAACGGGPTEDVLSVEDEFRHNRKGKDAGSTATSPDAASASTDAGTPSSTDAGTVIATPADAGGGCGPVHLGANASLGGTRLFPDDNPWNKDVSAEALDPSGAAILSRIGLATALHPDFGTTYDGAPNGIPYVVVGPAQSPVSISFTDYGDESDPGPYPVPAGAPVEGGASGTGDRHVLVVQCSSTAANHLGGLFELFSAYPQAGGSWKAANGARFDPSSNALRPAGWTSTDAAGLPVFAGLVRYDEVIEQREIRHALRFTVAQSRRAYVSPARHFASSLTDASLPPMGMRVRLKKGYDVSTFPASVQVILVALQRYGMFVADNGSSGYVSGAPDDRWNDNDLRALGRITFADLEVVKMGTVLTQ